MFHNAVTRWRFLTAILAVSLAVLTGCAQSTAVKPTTDEASSEAVEAGKKITGIRSAESAEAATVTIEGNQGLAYTSVKQPFPAGVVFYFPDTALSLTDVDTDSIQDSAVIESIQTSEMTEKGVTARVEILLKEDVAYEVDSIDGRLNVTFPIAEKEGAMDASIAETEAEAEKKAGPEAQLPMEPPSGPPATKLESVTTAAMEDGLKVYVNADGVIKDYKTFTVTNPARIVFDIYGVKADTRKEEQQQVGTRWVRRVRHFGYPDRVRMVLDTRPAYLDQYRAFPTNDGLMVLVGKETGKEQAGAAAAAEPAAALTQTAVDGKPAWVNRVDFSSEESGSSTVIVGTTRPVRYDIEKIENRRVMLKLYNTRLPSYQKRPLITTRFTSAVDRISPAQADEGKNLTLVTVELRESVPYRVEQVEDLLMVHFEPSDIPPKPFEQAQLPEWKRVLTESTAEAAVQAPEAVPGMEAAEAQVPKPAPEAAPATLTAIPPGTQAGEQRYTGEKIALDFYETDIKNVFRILREISGRNFAIDKDVTGKVTLTLDDPVPWDQVLDLVLKMNQLGMVQEGNIIRIATLQTLAKEEELRRGQLEARLKAEEQKEALDPLETAYFPISYANAQSDIRPHLESMLTKGRGSITVDDRTNLIIFTDVPNKVEQARQLVKKLDTVTPQVLIEARIVEATTSFTRNLGVKWDTTIGPDESTALGGEIIYDLATDLSVASFGTAGFAFTKIGGTAMTLNAELQAMEALSEGKIISTPKVITLDNKAATIKQGTEFPYNKLDADGNTTTEFLDIVLELTVTPHVTPDDRIAMTIQITKADQSGIINNVPILATKEAQTELLVNDGETFVIAGIIKNTVTEGADGIPGLMHVPLLGWLFKNKQFSDQKEELLIFITPKIIRLEQRSFS
ncbi:MAG: type IV pilus secretin PilQ [Desulfobacterales bacterium]|nr:type IV pilus secretin PilQ [Desulfobacterales bacterium]